MDRESVLQAVLQENWEPVISWLHKSKRVISKDDHLQYAANIFSSEFFAKLSGYPLDRPDIMPLLAMLHSMHRKQMHRFEPVYYKQLIINLALRSGADREMAYKFAKEFPKEDSCRKIIEEYERLKPKQVLHSQSNTIQVTQQNTSAQHTVSEHRIQLFKSLQEKQFFQALKNTFPTHQVYPNVAISCLLDWDNLKVKLTQEESDLFFKGIIDCVIFDQARDFLPVYFFELDSHFHDSEAIQKNDQLKDSIFTKAGLTLLRIRKLDRRVAENEFTELIRELINSK